MTFVLGVILNYVIFVAKIVRNTGVFIVIHNKTFRKIWKKERYDTYRGGDFSQSRSWQ